MTITLSPIEVDISIVSGQFPLSLQLSTVQILDVKVAGVGSPGIKGDKGDKGDNTLIFIAGEDISGHTAVYLGVDSKAYKASPYSILPIIGITTAAASIDTECTVQYSGLLSHRGWAFSIGSLISINKFGQLVTIQEPDATVTSIVGIANSPSSIVIAIQPQISLV